MSQKDFALSMDGEAFKSLRSDYDQMLRSTLAGMIETEQDQAEINIKVKITLTEDSAPDYSVAGGNHTREITKPKFEHTVTAVIQRKEKKTGTFSGEYELVWDWEAGRYIARSIEDGQQTLFDNDGEPGYADMGEQGEEASGIPELPASAEDVGDDTEPENEERVVDAAHDPTKPFGWLRQFIGQTMYVSEAMGNFAVRTSENKVVLSSATSPVNPFYCSPEKLSPHVDHHLICVGYGDSEIINITIECEDCCEVLYSLDAPSEDYVESSTEEATEETEGETGTEDDGAGEQESAEEDEAGFDDGAADEVENTGDDDGQDMGYGPPEE